ncbi:CMP-5'-phosphonoformate--3-phosphoglycerate phosphonoformyl transferase [Streptomyces sp. NPDC058685]|uniref:CMP-5'-phosphonoformate--3-phosphoglycerate phosphonoformyl transferase n=1 Tax=Streptomyces sp. NPDC058685 TaxID=3346598 RepID=UPI00366533B8
MELGGEVTMTKVYMIILDGAADHPVAALGQRTPLDAAVTPALDALASEARTSLITVIGKDIWPESDSGAMALLSYDPLLHYTGRGPLEGYGLGLVRDDGRTIAFRVNFASCDETGGILDRRTARGLSDEQLQALAGAVRDQVSLADLGVEFGLVAFNRHRGILSFTAREGDLSGQVTNTDPGFRNVGPFGFPVREIDPRPLLARPRTAAPADARAARVVNDFVARSAEVLRAHPVNRERRDLGELPANMLLVRDGGDAPRPLTAFREKFDCSLTVMGQIPAERGLAELIGAEFAYSLPQPGESEAAYLATAAQQVLAAPTEVVFIHLKGPDEPGHDNRPDDKRKAIELIDTHFLAPLLEGAGPRDVIAVTSDHATPCDMGIHSDDPVPALVRAPGLEPDHTTRLTEAQAMRGGLPVAQAVDLMPFLVKARP